MTEPPIVDAEPVEVSEEPEDGQMEVLGRKTARKRTETDGPPPRARRAKPAGKAKAAQPRARKSARGKSKTAGDQ